MKVGASLSVAVFFAVALLHLLRLATGTVVIVDNWLVPVWFSVFGVIIPLTLSILLWRESNHKSEDLQ